MKLILTALSVAFLSGSFALAEGDCCKGKKDCDKTQKEEANFAPCDKHKDGDKDKDEANLAECDKCKKDGDAKKEEEAKLAGCDKCKKDGDDTKKEEAQLS